MRVLRNVVAVGVIGIEAVVSAAAVKRVSGVHSGTSDHVGTPTVALVAKKVTTNVNTKESAKDRHGEQLRVDELVEVEQDLEAVKSTDDSDLENINKQIVALVRKRDAERRDDSKKSREISFLRTELNQLRASVAAGSTATSSTDASADAGSSAGGEAELAEADAAAAAADKTLAAASSGGSSSLRGTAVATESVAAAASTGSQQREAAEVAAQAQASAEKAERRRLEAQQVAQSDAQSDAHSAAHSDAQAAQTAQTAAQAAQAKRVARAEAHLAQKRQAEQQQAEAAAYRASQAQAAQRQQQADAVADSADDSFKQFMKEEDGEDDLSDPAYEESANALSGAIGWNRNDIEHNADKAVKSLTEAIGGKKVIQSVQGMMTGIR